MGQAPLQPALRCQPGLRNPQRWWGHPAKPLCSTCSEMLARARPGVCLCLHLPHARSGRGGRQRAAALGWELCGAVLCWPLPAPPRGQHFTTPRTFIK